jgi:hypothetical protein
MPNVVVEISAEMARVRELAPRLDRDRATWASLTIRAAEHALALNSYAEMRELLDDLRDIKDPKPPEAQ